MGASGLLLTNVAFGLNNVLRATGYPRRAMMTMVIGAVTNVVLDAIFVLWLDMGMVGAALATDIAMAVSAWFVVAHFFKKDVVLHFERGTFSLKSSLVLSIVTIGAAPCIVNVASCLVNALINRSLVDHGGDMAIEPPHIRYLHLIARNGGFRHLYGPATHNRVQLWGRTHGTS